MQNLYELRLNLESSLVVLQIRLRRDCWDCLLELWSRERMPIRFILPEKKVVGERFGCGQCCEIQSIGDTEVQLSISIPKMTGVDEPTKEIVWTIGMLLAALDPEPQREQVLAIDCCDSINSGLHSTRLGGTVPEAFMSWCAKYSATANLRDQFAAVVKRILRKDLVVGVSLQFSQEGRMFIGINNLSGTYVGIDPDQWATGAKRFSAGNLDAPWEVVTAIVGFVLVHTVWQDSLSAP
jgi:hypothetical protein